MGAQWVHIHQIWICLLDLVLKYWSRYELHITGAGSLSDSMNHRYAVSPEQNGLIFLDCNTLLRFYYKKTVIYTKLKMILKLSSLSFCHTVMMLYLSHLLLVFICCICVFDLLYQPKYDELDVIIHFL